MNSRAGAPRDAIAYHAALGFFLVSGAAGLLYEVVWLRHLSLVFGHTVHAVTTVLAAYMGGLALGSLLAGRRVDRAARPMRVYALLECCVGLFCLATPALFRATNALWFSIHRALEPGPLVAGLLQFALSALILLPPTTLMGATLPVLGRAVVRTTDEAATRVGTLYATNTWGAVLGTILTGFVLLPTVGLRATVWIGVLANLLIAAAAFLLDRLLVTRVEVTPPSLAQAPGAAGAIAQPGPAPEAHPRLTRPQLVATLAALAISGAASMGYEIAWTRALGLTLGSSTYAFSAMLVTFLIGLAGGAWIASYLLRRRRTGVVAFAVVEILISLLAVALLPAFGKLPEAFLRVLGHTGVSHGAALATQALLGFAVMIGPTLLIGTTFPLVIAAVGSSLERVGRDVGVVYGANTLGTIAGSIVAGFVLIPVIGIQRTVIVSATANLAAAVAVVATAREAGRRRLLLVAAAAVVLAALAMGLPRWDTKWMTVGAPVYAAHLVKSGVDAIRASQASREILLYEEGISTTVTVSRSPTALSLSVNGKIDASNTRDMATQLLLGHLGAVLHPQPRRALVIGLASGITAGALAQHRTMERIDVAELEPAMRRAARFFDRENRRVLDDPRVRVLDGDGRHILAAATEPYDLIVSEPSNPWIAGVASLFTREFYESARVHLAPGGIMVQWLQAYSIFPDDMRMVTRTFAEAFPNVSVWAGSLGDVLLVATPTPVRLDFATIDQRLLESPTVREDFERYRWVGENLVFRFALADEDVRRFAAGAALNTDDLPLLEFSAPLALYTGSAIENKALMRAFRRVDRPQVTGLDPGRYEGTSGRMRAAAVHWAEAHYEDAFLELERLGAASTLPDQVRMERARLLFFLGQFEPAWAELDALVAKHPDDADVQRYHRAMLALSDPRFSSQLQATLRYLAGRWYADPALLGDLVLQLGAEGNDRACLEVAIEQLGAAVAMDPSRPTTINSWAVALALAGRTAEADSAFGRALELEPRNASLHLNLALHLERTGRHEEAARAFATASELDPRLATGREHDTPLQHIGR